MTRQREIEGRLEKARNGNWIVADYSKPEARGRNWELADFGECGHHNRKVWVTTDNQAASQSNGSCPCEDADFAAHAPSDIRWLLERVKALELKCICHRIPSNDWHLDKFPAKGAA